MEKYKKMGTKSTLVEILDTYTTNMDTTTNCVMMTVLLLSSSLQINKATFKQVNIYHTCHTGDTYMSYQRVKVGCEK